MPPSPASEPPERYYGIPGHQTTTPWHQRASRGPKPGDPLQGREHGPSLTCAPPTAWQGTGPHILQKRSSQQKDGGSRGRTRGSSPGPDGPPGSHRHTRGRPRDASHSGQRPRVTPDPAPPPGLPHDSPREGHVSALLFFRSHTRHAQAAPRLAPQWGVAPPTSEGARPRARRRTAHGRVQLGAGSARRAIAGRPGSLVVLPATRRVMTPTRETAPRRQTSARQGHLLTQWGRCGPR